VRRAILSAAIVMLSMGGPLPPSQALFAYPAQQGPRLPQGRPGLPPPPTRPGPPPGSKGPRTRLFSPQDLGLLEGPDRDQWQKPDQIMDALGIADGSIVADIGAAGGWFTVQLARRVGPNGRVFAEDIQRPMIEAIGRRVQRENLTNVTPVLGTVTDPRLPPGIDAVLIVEAYGEMEDPVALLRNVARSLKPLGRIGIVDFTPGAGGPGPASEQRVNPDSVIEAARAAGLQLIARDAVSTFQFLLVFGRTAASR
jgi:SAM-dependent methyltransferase